MGFLGLPRKLLVRPGSLLGASWACLGASWGYPGASWTLLGFPRGLLGPSWRLLGGPLGPLRVVLGASWGSPGGAWAAVDRGSHVFSKHRNSQVFSKFLCRRDVLWGPLEPFVASWAALEASWGALGRSWARFEASWGALGPLLACLWPPGFLRCPRASQGAKPWFLRRFEAGADGRRAGPGGGDLGESTCGRRWGCLPLFELSLAASLAPTLAQSGPV